MLGAANVWMFRRVVDDVLVPGDPAPFPALAAMLAALALAAAAVGYLASVATASVGLSVVNRLRTSVFRHLLGLPVRFFERRPPGDLLARLGGDVTSVEAFALSGVTVVVTAVVTLVTNATLLARLSWRMLALAVVVGPLLLVATRLFSRRLHARARVQREAEGEVIAAADELLANVAAVQAFGAEDDAARRFDDAADRSRRADLATARFGAGISPAVGVLEAAGGLGLLWFGTREIAAGRLTPGGLLVFLTLVTQLFGPIKNLGGLLTTLSTASAGAERVLELLDVPTAAGELGGSHLVEAGGTGGTGGTGDGVVSVEDVWFHHEGAERPALAGVSLTVRPGELVVLVGPSGAGKSTLLRLLRRFDDPGRGRIVVDGVDLRAIAPATYRRTVTTTFQQPVLFHDTLGANVRLGRPDATDDDVWTALAAADLAEFARSLPAGLDTPLGPRGGLLSGGQAQRLSLARALLRDAPVVVLDEPTTGLDPAAAANVTTSLRRLARNRSVLVVSHSPEVAERAHRVVVLAEGRVVAEGTHRELLERCPPYRHLLGVEGGGVEGGGVEGGGVEGGGVEGGGVEGGGAIAAEVEPLVDAASGRTVLGRPVGTMSGGDHRPADHWLSCALRGALTIGAGPEVVAAGRHDVG